MKHPKRLNVAMKKLLQINNLDPDDYWYIKNTSDYLVIVHKKTGKQKMLDWSDE